MNERAIKLWFCDGVLLILKMPSGIIYTNQVGATMCLHPEQEGVLVPCDNEIYAGSERLLNRLNSILEGRWTDTITTEEADAVDRILAECPPEGHWRVKVDRSLLQESCEAWVHVIVEYYEALPKHFADSMPLGGILTWRNSD